MGIAKCRESQKVELVIEIEVSSQWAESLTRVRKEWSGRPTMQVLAILGLGHQLVTIVILAVVVLLLTGVASVAVAAQAQGIGKGEDSPKSEGEEKREASTGKSERGSK